MSDQKQEAPTHFTAVKRATAEELKQYGDDLGLEFQKGDIDSFITLLEPTFQAYDSLLQTPDVVPKTKYPRIPGDQQPTPQENTHNAWYQKFIINGAQEGPLKGKTIVLKDNISVAGIPLMNGCVTMQGFTCDQDATVVERVLDAGAQIVGKAHCESLCLSGGSHTNSLKPVLNPHNKKHMSGGSSSGSAVLVSLGEADMSIGGDQGGSIRIPSCWSGTYGMKPTWSLVPYTGAFPIEPTCDHLGPITSNVQDNALLLEVLAGRDELDPRQTYAQKEINMQYLKDLKSGVKNLKIGILKEGFNHSVSQKEVNEKVLAAAEQFKKLGAVVEEVSIPEHLMGYAVWTGIICEGTQKVMMEGNGVTFGTKGHNLTSMAKYHSFWRQQSTQLSESLKIIMLVSKHLEKHYGNHFYAKSQNLSRALTQKFDEKLKEYDILLMPTLPFTAPEIPSPDDHTNYVAQALGMVQNTATFDATGHPAMNVPCGMHNGLPIGMQLVGRQFDEATIYKAAYAFEQLGDWKKF